MNYLASYGKIQLSGSGQIGADELHVGQLHGPEVALRVEKIHERCPAVLVRVCHGVADSQRLVVVLRLVWLEQGHAALHLHVGRVHVAEDLRSRGFSQLLIAAYIDLSALLLALVPVEDAERNVDAGAQCIAAKGVVECGVVGVPSAKGRIGGTVGEGQLVIGVGLLNGLKRGAQVGPGVQGYLTKIFERLQFL